VTVLRCARVTTQLSVQVTKLVRNVTLYVRICQPHRRLYLLVLIVQVMQAQRQRVQQAATCVLLIYAVLRRAKNGACVLTAKCNAQMGAVYQTATRVITTKMGAHLTCQFSAYIRVFA